MHRHKLTQQIALCALLVIPPAIQAAEWSIEPRVSLRAGRNDNIRLTADDHSPVWESVLAPSAKFGVKTETSGLTGDAGLAIRRFTGGTGRESSSVLNREDYHFNTDVFHNGQLSSIRANLDYTRDSTLDSELDQTGKVSDQRATRDKLTLAPSWSTLLNEVTRLELAYQYNDASYKNDPGIADLVDYKYHTFDMSLVRQLSPRIKGTAAAGYSSYRPDTDFDSDTLSLQLGLAFNVSETLLASFLAGQRSTTADSFIGTGICLGALPGATFPTCTGGIAIPTGTANTEFKSTSPVYTASITKTLEAGSLSASLSRASYPSSLGELLDTTRLLLTGDRQITETLRASLRLEYTENETIVGRVGLVTNQQKETFFRVTPRASWRWSREWEVAGEYQYVDNDDPVLGTATRNAFYVTLIYRPDKTYISR